ncbi:DUF1846 domain-containing protein [Vagococcus humatus]|uniref:DUF1846 domain-containing protein n=1 Tax=Vagococcus humatus TaxID=1889241 RepID=A0A3S0A714_9ENTE|nr:DUF1846 domain-containing protein [Vagococcus humatus]RST90400.1 hypothetical protein C7P63_04810 [Vagococcus humatus]
MKKIGFDSKKYIEEQSKYILERVNHYDKLYLEFGGKLIGDKHAKRVLPGFDEDSKIKMLQKLKDQAEILMCVYAGDIERNKVRGDLGITYDMDVLRLIDELREYGLEVNSVVITRYTGQPSTKLFINKLERRNIKVYKHGLIEGYPSDVDLIMGEGGFAKNEYIPTTKPIVVVTGPGGGSGKLATCLNQLYHENRQGTQAGYSKFETFPVWNLPLKHPVNIAYEAATVDLKDVNMIDSFHFEAYNEVAVNYNRDVETFPVIKRIIERITGHQAVYQSPTDMGVNRVGFGIVDDQVVQKAAKQEIIRRCFATEVDFKKGLVEEDIVNRMRLIMEDAGLKKEDREPVLPARTYSEQIKQQTGTNEPVSIMALELPNGKTITGKTSALMDSGAAVILNAVKELGNIADEILLLSPVILETIQAMKTEQLHSKNTALTANEILIALAISAVTNPTAELAYQQLSKLEDAQAHSTVMIGKDNEQTLKRLGIDITCDPIFASENLFYI